MLLNMLHQQLQLWWRTKSCRLWSCKCVFTNRKMLNFPTYILDCMYIYARVSNSHTDVAVSSAWAQRAMFFVSNLLPGWRTPNYRTKSKLNKKIVDGKSVIHILTGTLFFFKILHISLDAASLSLYASYVDFCGGSRLTIKGHLSVDCCAFPAVVVLSPVARLWGLMHTYVSS